MNSSAIRATEDDVSCRLVRFGGRGFVLKWPPRRRTFSPPVALTAITSVAALLLVSLSLVLIGCGSSPAGETTTSTAGVTTPAAADTTTTVATDTTTTVATFPVTVVDDNKANVTIKVEPTRIVSTAPSNTELLFALGLGDRVVGVTSLDDYPPEAAKIAKVGDFQINTEAVMALSPDLVIGYAGAEEALKPVQAKGTPVIILNPATVEGIYANIATVGMATGATAKAAELVDSIKAQIKQISDAAAATGQSPKVFYAVDNTLWTCGPGSFVDDLLQLAHATNVAAMRGADSAGVQAYYQFAPEQLVASDPDIILVPNTAYKSADEFTGDARFKSLRAVKEGHVYLINDVVVTRPGPRIGDGLKTLVDIIHPGAL
ncbi:MAG: ABC transporter substrate-binding protein [Actinobacteria bacterium]|nr:ABC transporter substrate-binding protein [Actinomycetota bacterium]